MSVVQFLGALIALGVNMETGPIFYGQEGNERFLLPSVFFLTHEVPKQRLEKLLKSIFPGL